jgi:hypothetical protein
MSKTNLAVVQTKAKAATLGAAAHSSGKPQKERVVGITTRLSVERWKRLRMLAAERELKLHDLIQEGLDYVLAKGAK